MDTNMTLETLLHIDTVATFFRSKLAIPHKVNILFHNDEKDYTVIEMTNGKIGLCFSKIVVHLFSVNGLRTNHGLLLTPDDRVVSIFMDEDDQNFFAIDTPKQWTPEERLDEGYKFYTVSLDMKIMDCI